MRAPALLDLYAQPQSESELDRGPFAKLDSNSTAPKVLMRLLHVAV